MQPGAQEMQPDTASPRPNAEADAGAPGPAVRTQALCVITLLLLYAVLAVWSGSRKSATYDEGIHMVGGLSYWTCADFRLHPENGVLPQRAAGAPLAMRYPYDGLTDTPAWAGGDLWNAAHGYLWHSGHDPSAMLAAARAMITLLGAAMGLCVFLWTRRLWGFWPGALALAVFALSPTMIAHGRVASSDMAAALMFFAAAWWASALYQRASWARAAWGGVIIGAGLCAKFSGVLILPVIGLVAAARLIDRRPWLAGWRGQATAERFTRRLRSLAAVAVIAAIIAWAAIWACYGFRYSLAPAAANYAPPWESTMRDLGALQKPIQLARDAKLLPEAYLYGFAFVVKTSGARRAFLHGDYSVHGWRTYFPIAFALKTPLPALALIGVGLLAILLRYRRPSVMWALAPGLWATLAVYWAFAIKSNLNIGHRHLLPVYPLMLVLAGGALAGAARMMSARGLLCVAAVAWLAVESALAFPHHLSYFNQLGGGSKHGYRWLVDSSFDWGQDLAYMRPWLDARPDEDDAAPVYLSYFGTANPTHDGLDVRRLPGTPDYDMARRPFAATLGPGWYCISATILQSAAGPQYGPWSREDEQAYAELSKVFSSDAPPTDADSGEPDGMQPRWRRFEVLRMKRLCAHLRQREPDDRIGRAILAYRVTEQELAAALGDGRNAAPPASRGGGAPADAP